MRNYKVILKLTGPITQVPDSQKLFGALMYMFAEKYGDERAADLASAGFVQYHAGRVSACT